MSFSRPRLPCLICKEELHSIAKCPVFAAKPMADKKTFIHQNQLCFGCLRKGHITKDCRTKHICGVCGRRHPTCLHDERVKKPGEATMKGSTSTEGKHLMRSIKSTPILSLERHVPRQALFLFICHLRMNLKKKFSLMLFLIHRVIQPSSWKILPES